MSRLKRSLSSFSPVSLSQKRQVSGLISSASTSLSPASRPTSILKSTSVTPLSSKKGVRISLTLRPSSSQNSRSSSETPRSEEHTSELQSRQYLVCRLLLEKKKNNKHMFSGVSDVSVL